MPSQTRAQARPYSPDTANVGAGGDSLNTTLGGVVWKTANERWGDFYIFSVCLDEA